VGVGARLERRPLVQEPADDAGLGGDLEAAHKLFGRDLGAVDPLDVVGRGTQLSVEIQLRKVVLSPASSGTESARSTLVNSFAWQALALPFLHGVVHAPFRHLDFTPCSALDLSDPLFVLSLFIH